MATLAPMPPRSVPAAPIVEAVERYARANGLSLKALSRQWASDWNVGPGALLRLLSRGRAAGVMARTSAERILDWADLEPVEPATARCTRCGCHRRHTSPTGGTLCDPCKASSCH